MIRDNLANKDYFDARIIEEEEFLKEDYADVEDYIANRGTDASGITSAIVRAQLDCAKLAYTRGEMIRDNLANKDYFDARIIEEEEFLKEDYADVEDYIANRGTDASGITSAIVRAQLDCAKLAYTRGDEVSEVAARVDKAFKDYHYLIRVYQEHEDYFRGGQSYSYWHNLIYLSYSILYQPSQDAVDKLLFRIEFSKKLLEYKDPILLAMIAYLKGEPIDLTPLVDAVEFPESFEDLWLAISNTGGGKIPPLKRYLETWYERNDNDPDGPSGFGSHKKMISYKGYWCWEAAAVAVMMDIDDTSFRDHEHYPKDLADWAKEKKKTVK